MLDTLTKETPMKAFYHLPPSESPEWEKVHPPLNMQQRSIVKYLSEGLTQAEVARRCHISHRTLKLRLEAMRIEHGCNTTTQLCIQVYQQLLQDAAA